MSEPVLHIVIIWPHGNEKREQIVSDISNSFKLLNIFLVEWEASYFYENLKRFYAHSLQDKSPTELEAILKHKIEHCGNGPFTALLFEDDAPNFENRKTSNGTTLVNANVFDKKALYRKWVGGGHKIHASDTLFETNKDIALLFGCTTETFKKKFTPSKSIRQHTQNIVGVPTYQSIEELFFVLNQTMSYVVLRNFEALPDAYFVADHGDIDLLVENKKYICYLTGALNCFPEGKDRVYHTISVKDEAVPFDFRYVGDGYYDTQWQLAILNQRQLTSKGFYIPTTDHYFYSLLYHAFIQKRKVSDDYKQRLQAIAEEIDIEFKATQSSEATFKLLDAHMQSKGYTYSLPKDSTVYFNKKFVEQGTTSHNAKQSGVLISSTISRTNSASFLTEVYETDNGFLKIANDPIVTNEIEFLSTLKDSGCVPRILNTVMRDGSSEVLLEKIDGVPLSQLVRDAGFWHVKNIKEFIMQLFDMLLVLVQNDIIHRDIRPANILVQKTEKGYKPWLIDFGWSTYYNKRVDAITPKGLGYTNAYPGEGFSDMYAMGKCIQFLTTNLHYLNPIVTELCDMGPAAYQDKDTLYSCLRSLKQQVTNKMYSPTKKDRVALLVKRYKLNELTTKIFGKRAVKRIKRQLS